MFGKHWTAARGLIVDKRVVHSTGDGVSIHEFVVEVTTASGEAFRAKAGEPKIAMDFRSPWVGDTVGIEYDEKSRDVRFDKSDPQLSLKAFKKARTSSFDETLHAAPGTPTGGVAATQGIDIEALLKAQGITGGSTSETHVVQLDDSSPEGAAVREALLRALGKQPPPETPNKSI